MKKLSEKLTIILENVSNINSKKETNDNIIVDESVWRAIRHLSENDWYRGRTSRTLAARKLHQIAESRDLQARRFMKALNKAAKSIAIHLEKGKK